MTAPMIVVYTMEHGCYIGEYVHVFSKDVIYIDIKYLAVPSMRWLVVSSINAIFHISPVVWISLVFQLYLLLTEKWKENEHASSAFDDCSCNRVTRYVIERRQRVPRFFRAISFPDFGNNQTKKLITRANRFHSRERLRYHGDDCKQASSSTCVL